MKACPHERIEYCPLYVESHYGRGLGCVDDMALPCLVARGKMNYAKAVAKVGGDLVLQLGMLDMLRMAREQRARNRRAAGVR